MPNTPRETGDSRDAPASPTRVTHKTIAAHLGVSQSTVSLVLNGKAEGRVSEALQAQIRHAAATLGYQPNAAARTLRLGRSQVLALLVPQVDNPFFAPVYLGAEHAAHAHGFTLSLVHTRNQADVQEALLHTLGAHAVDGFVAWRTPAAASLAALGTRLVLVEVQHAGVPSVGFDIADGVRQAIAHLVALGHTRIAHLAANLDHPTFQLRRITVDRSLAALIPEGRVLRARAPLDVVQAQAAALKLLDASPRPTAIVCDDDVLAISVYVAAAARGIAIPHALSVVGFGGTTLAQVCIPPLTTVALPAEDLGAQAVESLVQRLAGATPRDVVLPAQIRLGASTAAPCD